MLPKSLMAFNFTSHPLRAREDCVISWIFFFRTPPTSRPSPPTRRCLTSGFLCLPYSIERSIFHLCLTKLCTFSPYILFTFYCAYYVHRCSPHLYPDRFLIDLSLAFFSFLRFEVCLLPIPPLLPLGPLVLVISN